MLFLCSCPLGIWDQAEVLIKRPLLSLWLCSFRMTVAGCFSKGFIFYISSVGIRFWRAQLQHRIMWHCYGYVTTAVLLSVCITEWASMLKPSECWLSCWRIFGLLHNRCHRWAWSSFKERLQCFLCWATVGYFRHTRFLPVTGARLICEGGFKGSQVYGGFWALSQWFCIGFCPAVLKCGRLTDVRCWCI